MEIPALVLIIITLSLSNVCPCFCFTAFIFGDSLVDAGNNNYLFTLSKADSPPYGIDFSPSGGQPTGRFTNGRTIADIVGEALGSTSFPPPYLAPNTSAATAFRAGINYASGASGILDQTGTLFIGRVPLTQQISNFEQTRSYMVKMVGENTTNIILKNSIFSLTIGSNDVLNYFQPSIPLFSDKVSPTLFQDFMISNFTIQLEKLYRLGARKFVVVNIGPLGCIPFIRAVSLNILGGKCSTKVNALVRGYNKKLKEELDRMNNNMGRNAIFVYANSYDIFREIILNFPKYGFVNNDGPCCGGYIPPFLCFKRTNSSASSAILCDNRSNYVFWDAYHPTEAANLIIADKLLNGDKGVCYPMNIRHLYDYII
ncbi:GDSL-like Lipase/Acylhydrolase superfamily protein [Forsythia ovata]|uniref:GDSL-like Lipase/Acylhydrolase superfamily protein n=1 Tax=Forsythia ovata TaxID=205694 RepID=A0ABD1WRX9_9LAMI